MSISRSRIYDPSTFATTPGPSDEVRIELEQAFAGRVRWNGLTLEGAQQKCYVATVNSREFKRWLAKQGCTFEAKRAGSGHLIVRRGKLKSELPMHGGGKELGVGLINKIKRDLGLK
jgi:mRNA interferase HicA